MSTTQYLIDKARSYGEAILPNGERIYANSRAHLRRLYLQKCIELECPPPNLSAAFETAVCAALPPERAAVECKFCDEEATPPEMKKERVLRLDDVFRFLGGMSRWLANGGGFVDAEEAERRASVCARCPLNSIVPGCRSCAGLVGKTLELLSGRGTKYDTLLESCEVCGCQNRAAVHFPAAAQDLTLEYPAWCWKTELKK